MANTARDIIDVRDEQTVDWKKPGGDLAMLYIARKRRISFFSAFLQAAKLAAKPAAEEEHRELHRAMSMVPSDILIAIACMAGIHPLWGSSLREAAVTRKSSKDTV